MKTNQRLMLAAMFAAGAMFGRMFAADVAFYPFSEGNDEIGRASCRERVSLCV